MEEKSIIKVPSNPPQIGVAIGMGEEIQRQRRRFNRAWEVLSELPFPEVSCERLRELHNDISQFDVETVKFIQQWRTGPPHELEEDKDLSQSLAAFKSRTPLEVEGRRSLLAYKNKVDALIREYNLLTRLL